MPGRKPKPTELKKLEGNPGRRPLNENEPKPDLADITLPRGKLPKEGQNLWKKLAPRLLDLGILTEVDLPAFEMMCLHYALARDAFEVVDKLGLFVKDRENAPRKNPAMQLFRDNSAAFKAYMIEFGMTPSSRSRIEANPIDDEPSLADLLYDGVFDNDE